MLNRKVFFALAAQTCFLTYGAFGQATTTPKTFTRSSVSLPVGLALTETAQVALVNTAVATSTGTAASCTGSVSFLNASGAVIGTATSFTLASGQISLVSLPYGSAGATGGARAQIRAEVQLTGTTPATAPCALAFSIQTFDTASGVTHVYIGDGGSLAAPVPVGFGR